jgi:hypothetical protein
MLLCVHLTGESIFSRAFPFDLRPQRILHFTFQGTSKGRGGQCHRFGALHEEEHHCCCSALVLGRAAQERRRTEQQTKKQPKKKANRNEIARRWQQLLTNEGRQRRWARK